MILEGLRPESVFYYFEEISKIPHGSTNTKAISDYVVSVAKENNLKYYQDEANNVIVYKDGIYEGADKEPVILQGHLDMVCEKNYETDARFDFEKDPLNLAVMDDFIYAKGTTLGGDDGIGVAYMLALLTDKKITAPPLECVFTSDEEIGMIGAGKLDFSKLSGKKLINLDQEDELTILTSCAGGVNIKGSISLEYEEKTGVPYNIVICGLTGGHSGTEIHKNRANANLLMGRLLNHIKNDVKFSLIDISGGLQDNAIPRECFAEVLVNTEDVELFEDKISAFESIIKNEYRSTEKNVCIYAEVDEDVEDKESIKALTNFSRDKIISYLVLLPNGVIRMSDENEKLVQTSTNAGVIRINKDAFEIVFCVRSSIESEKNALCEKIVCLTETLGGTAIASNPYPAWEYREYSDLRDCVFSAYQKVYSRNPRIAGIHAGLETGIFYNNIKDLDIVSIGPKIDDIHTPKEKLSISSTEMCYRVILEVLQDLARY